MTQDVIPYTFIALPSPMPTSSTAIRSHHDLLFFLTENILGWHTDRKPFSNGFICSRTGIARAVSA